MAHLSAEVLRDVDVAALEEPGLPQDLLLVSVGFQECSIVKFKAPTKSVLMDDPRMVKHDVNG